MKKDASPIGDVLKDVFRLLEEKKKDVTREEVEAAWREAAGEAAGKHSRPAALRLGILTVEVDNSVRLQDLSMRKRQLLKGLKRALGKDRISEIKFRIGEG